MTISTSAQGFDTGLILASADLERARKRFAARGVVVIGPPAIKATLFAALVEEARHQRATSAWDLVGTDRADRVDQVTVRAELGPLARALVAADSTATTLHHITGEYIRPSWGATCMTYYEKPGQFLGEHTDKRQDCRYAMLVYVHVSHAPAGASYGTGLHVRLADPPGATLVVTAAANRIVLLNGSQLAHWRPPLAPGESVFLLAGCFAVTSV
jgi:hypothetical protein